MSDHADLIEYLNAADLGPVASVDIIDASGVEVHRIVLADSDRLGATARRWVVFLDLIDATAGRRRARDKGVHLNLRGFLPGRGPVVFVVIPFTAPRQVALIDELIERQDLDDLTARLSELDMADRRAAHIAANPTTEIEEK
jgi:hypothetical protein